MSIKIHLAITPVGTTADVLTQAHQEQHASSRAAENTKARRLKFEWSVPGTRSTLEVVRVELDGKARHATYHCTGNPADYLIGQHALSANSQVADLVPLQFALFKVALQSWLPDLSDEALEGITHAHCRLESITVAYYFEFENASEAYRAWLNWHQHAKVVFDGGNRMPTRTNTWKRSPVRVTADADCRDAFLVALPLGQARFALRRDPGSYPSAKPSVQSADKRIEMLAQLRCLLCIEISVELSKFTYIDSSGLALRLPSDFQLWVPSKMPESPAQTIWDRFCWESWLQAELLNESDPMLTEDVEGRSPLAWEMQAVADAYFAGDYLRRHPQIDGDHKKFEKYREALIAKVGIDILNPWSVAKLNLGKELKQDFALENRFLPHRHEGFAPHTLSQQTMGAAICKLNTTMQDKPGWSFDVSAYEDNDE